MRITSPKTEESFSYDKKSISSIYEYSLKLVGKSLEESVQLPENLEDIRNRGKLGVLVEKYFFRHVPPNDSSPDFPEAGLELKTTGIIRQKSGKLVAKERLVLTMIDYDEILRETWEDNKFFKKCGKMLILFYEYVQDVPVVSRKFLDSKVFIFPEEDLPQIKRDWEFIREKIAQGRAHELSEGDTKYLGACRKGAGGTKESLRSQPNSKIDAKSRAFSLKQSYVTTIFENYESNAKWRAAALEELETLGVDSGSTLEEITAHKFAKYLGKEIRDLGKELSYPKSAHLEKNYYANLALRVLSPSGRQVAELKKAGIEIKTIMLRNSWTPKESMSFPKMDYQAIVSQEWVESDFFETLERKFLFVIFRKSDEGTFLERVTYWNMPYADRETAKFVWEDTKLKLTQGKSDFIKASEGMIVHVRPKAQNSKILVQTPFGEPLGPKCFWLNAKYIGEQLEKTFQSQELGYETI